MMMKVIKKLVGKAPLKRKKTIGTKKTKLDKISGEELFSLIEKKAYEFYEKRGCPQGDDQSDWYKAEKSVRANLRKK